MEAAVHLEQITRTFTDAENVPVTAVDSLSLDIARGEIFAFVGPDGAGKTTTIRMMCGLIPPDRGTIEILGLDVRNRREDVKQRIGYLSQRFSLYGDLSIDENIDFFAEIHKLRSFQRRKEELLEFTRLTPFRKRLAGRLSGGMKQKLALACTLIHTPEIIFLDEPTTGVDPVSRRDFWKILSGVLKSGITIVMATPYLDEAERCTTVALMDRGRLMTVDAPDRIRDTHPYHVFELSSDDNRALLDIFAAGGSFKNVQLFGDRIHVSLRASKQSREEVEQFIAEKGLRNIVIRPVAASLEDVFIARMGS